MPVKRKKKGHLDGMPITKAERTAQRAAKLHGLNADIKQRKDEVALVEADHEAKIKPMKSTIYDLESTVRALKREPL